LDFMLGMCDYKGYKRHHAFVSFGTPCILLEVAVKKIGPVLANWNKKHAFDLKEMYHVEAASIEPCC